MSKVRQSKNVQQNKDFKKVGNHGDGLAMNEHTNKVSQTRGNGDNLNIAND